MKAILDDALFSMPGATTRLVKLFVLAQQKHHRLELDDLNSPAFAAWLDRQGADLRNDFQAFLDECFTLEDQEPAKRIVRVTAEERSEWDEQCPRLCLEDALRLLGKPFTIVLEDRESDRQFLCCIMSADERERFESALREDVIFIEHGGGIPGIKRWIAARGGDPFFQRTAWLLFDSDARYPEEPGEDPQAASDECERHHLPFHRLKRRFIESYLPRRALQCWADEPHSERGVRQQKVATFYGDYFNTKSIRRHYFNMKKGFVGDKDPSKARDLYEGIPRAEQDVLRGGFGTPIGTAFRPEVVDEIDLRDDGSFDELRGVVNTLLALLR